MKRTRNYLGAMRAILNAHNPTALGFWPLNFEAAPQQTPEQRASALAAAEAKRERRAAKHRRRASNNHSG